MATTTGISAIYAMPGYLHLSQKSPTRPRLARAAAAERLQDMAGKGGLFLPVPSGTGAIDLRIAGLRQDEPEKQD
ncbi:hypothetical protein D5F52_07855 [Brevibacillus laterosporus]|nr:hypothetical protein D5F52_07855 [Brevibacillus laterosporus]